MDEPATHVSHLATDDRIFTVCGQSWQGWQEPSGFPRGFGGRPLPPHSAPRHGDRIMACQACMVKALHG